MITVNERKTKNDLLIEKVYTYINIKIIDAKSETIYHLPVVQIS